MYKLKLRFMENVKKTGFLIISFTLKTLCFGQSTTGVKVERYNSDDSLLTTTTTDSYCVWSTNADSTTLYYGEYDSTQNVLHEFQFQIGGFSNEEITTTLYLEKDGTVFTATFWKDRDLVAYTFKDSFVLMSGEVKY